MNMKAISSILSAKGYRDTQPRRLVLEALTHMPEPGSPYEIGEWIAKRHGAISVVTVYRILDLLLSLGLAHRHPCSGNISLCEHPGKSGTHAYLHCHDCGDSQEFFSEELATITKRQAAKRGFKAASPMLEIVGICQKCVS